MRSVLLIILSLSGFVAGYLLTPASDPSPSTALAAVAEERADETAAAGEIEQAEAGACPMGLAPQDCCGSPTCQVTTAEGGCPAGLERCEQAAGNAADISKPTTAAIPGALRCGGDPMTCQQAGCAAASAVDAEGDSADQAVPLDDR